MGLYPHGLGYHVFGISVQVTGQIPLTINMFPSPYNAKNLWILPNSTLISTFPSPSSLLSPQPPMAVVGSTASSGSLSPFGAKFFIFFFFLRYSISYIYSLSPSFSHYYKQYIYVPVKYCNVQQHFLCLLVMEHSVPRHSQLCSEQQTSFLASSFHVLSQSLITRLCILHDKPRAT